MKPKFTAMLNLGDCDFWGNLKKSVTCTALAYIRSLRGVLGVVWGMGRAILGFFRKHWEFGTVFQIFH